MYQYIITSAIMSLAALMSSRTADWLLSLLRGIFRDMGLINIPLENWINLSATTLTANGETLMEYFFYTT